MQKAEGFKIHARLYHADETCDHCGGVARRVHRTFSERLLYEKAFQCASCGNRQFKRGLLIADFCGFACCPSCGAEKLRIFVDLDPIEPVYKSLLSRLWKLTGGTLYHCRPCRLQFYDFRRSREAVAAIERHRLTRSSNSLVSPSSQPQ